MKSVLLFGIILQVTITFSQGFSGDNSNIDVLTYDTLHIYPSKYENNNLQPSKESGKYIGLQLDMTVIKEQGLDTLYPAKRYTVTNMFIADSAASSQGYIITCDNSSDWDSFIIYVVLDKDGQYISSHIVAFFRSIEGTMEETMNAWLFDEDGDGDLDLAIFTYLLDYELPDSGMDNITGVRSSFYRNESGKYISEYMSKELSLALDIKR